MILRYIQGNGNYVDLQINYRKEVSECLIIWYYLLQVGTNNKLLVIGCESGLVICAHVAKREEIYRRQLESSCNACVVVDQSIILGCTDGKVIQFNSIQ